MAVKAFLDGPETWVHVAMAKQHRGTDPAGFAQVSPFTSVGLAMRLRGGGFLARFGREVFVRVVESCASSGTVRGKGREVPDKEERKWKLFFRQ